MLEEPSTVIPIHCPDGDPPEWAMIELNGSLIPPVEVPTQDEIQTILGDKDRVELGRLQIGPDKVRCRIP
jgi:hypothetical protein